MSMKNKISILGGGPAGMAIAHYSKKAGYNFELFEASDVLGGNCITLNENEFLFDSGAHRLHDKDTETTEIIKALLKEDLQLINVPSQIMLDEEFIDFPLSPLELIKYLGLPRFCVEGLKILLSTQFKKSKPYNFKQLAEESYGEKISNLFLLNYTEKLWGLPPEKLSIQVAGNRLKGLNVKTFLKELFFGKQEKTAHLDGSFYYPKYGIGTIFDQIEQACGSHYFLRNNRITKIHHSNKRIHSLELNNHEQKHQVEHVASSLPLSLTIHLLDPPAPKEILNISNSLKFRNIILLAFFIDKETINSNGSMYFPSKKYPFTRIYEPRNRSKWMAPEGKTSLVVEIPCQKGDPIWSKDENKLTKDILSELLNLSFFKEEELIGNKTHRIHHAYPILEVGFEDKITRLYEYLNTFENLDITGRNGLFAYSHIHDHMINARTVVSNFSQNTNDAV